MGDLLLPGGFGWGVFLGYHLFYFVWLDMVWIDYVE